MANDNRFYLNPEHSIEDKYVNYCISTIDMHDTAGSQTIFKIACDIMDEVFADMTVISKTNYPVKCPPRKRLFMKYKPAVYEKGGFADKIIARIIAQKLDYEYCIKEYDESYFYEKDLYISSKKYSYNFFELISEKTDYRDGKQYFLFEITGYNKQDAAGLANINALVNDLTSNDCSSISFMVKSYKNTVKITVNPYRYSVEKLMQIIDKAMKKYNKELEIHI